MLLDNHNIHFVPVPTISTNLERKGSDQHAIKSEAHAIKSEAHAIKSEAHTTKSEAHATKSEAHAIKSVALSTVPIYRNS